MTTAVSLTVALSAVAGALGLSSGGTFTDDDGNIHESSIEAIAAAGITNGCNPPTSDKYCPSTSVSRGQMAAFLDRALGWPATNKDFFTDDNDSVFEDSINRMAAAGVSKGCNPDSGSTKFCPDTKVTRGQMAAFLVRALGYTDDGGGDIFTDDGGSIFESEIDRLATAGVTKGCNPPSNTKFCPDNEVPRDQMASFLARALGLLARALDLDPIIPSSGSGRWMPEPGTTWQWQLTGAIDTTVDAEMFNIDLFDASSSVVAQLHGKGTAVVCYLSAGSWENWRPDADDFPQSVLGSSNGWPGEKWLDIRKIDVVGPIMEARFDLCKAKGFDAIEVDNIDGYTNNTGFPLKAADQLAYNRFLADAAHARGLSIGLKNDLEQVNQLVSLYDFAINEQCAQYDECDMLTPFIAANKAVFHVEYSLDTGQFCDEATALGFSSMKKKLSLNAWRQYCT